VTLGDNRRRTFGAGQVAQALEVDAVRMDLVGLGHGEQQQVELLE